MVKDRHYRLVAVTTEKVVIQSYVRESHLPCESLIGACNEFRIPLDGEYYLERLAWDRGEAHWVRSEPVLVIEPRK